MKQNVIVVGGGIAGLAAAIYLARGGRNVTIFEKRRNLGGRAVTFLRRGFRFNLGPHAIYRKGAGSTVYRELGIPILGGRSGTHATALVGSEQHKLPVSLMSILLTSLLSARAKFEAVSLLMRIRAMDPSAAGSITVRDWLDANVKDDRLREVIEALFRFATYSPDVQQSASAALQQLKLVMRGFVYVDEGWQRIVDSLHSNAVSAGVNFVTSARVVGIDHDTAVRGVRIGGLDDDDTWGTPLAADTVVVAVGPQVARELLGDSEFARGWRDLKPITAACLDVALTKLPNPKRTFALGVDRPVYFGVHSTHAQLTPRGGALVHVAKYQQDAFSYDDEYDEEVIPLNADGLADQQELEGVLDEVQPGWRELVVHRRFLPSLTVSNALVTPAAVRPEPVTAVRGLYLAGDWVSAEGSMADAALSSARAAAKAILSFRA
ncbi:MAG TPA: FAD-dependent oxidoreductase [Thermoanaerobaculia bacterium]